MKNIRQLFEESECFGKAGADALFGDAEADTLPVMTVCIGALCDGGKSAVLAADRQVSFPAFGLRADGSDCKIAQVCPRVFLAAAGNPPSNSFLKSIKADTLSHPSAPETAKSIFSALVELWRRRVELTVLLRYSGRTYPQFLEACSRKELPEEIIKDIWEKIKQIPIDTAFLVAAADEEQAELYAVAEPDGSKPLDSPGFGAIGIGAQLAMTELFQHQQHLKQMDVPSAVYAVYEAKKAADRDLRMGKATDMAVISVGKEAQLLDKTAIECLDRIYQSKRPPALTESEKGAIGALLPKPAGAANEAGRSPSP